MTLLGVDIGTTHVKAAPTTKTAGSSALASGLVERAPLSFPIIFLGLGFLIGERGFGLLTFGPEDPTQDHNLRRGSRGESDFEHLARLKLGKLRKMKETEAQEGTKD